MFEDGSTQEDIADAVGADKATISRRLEDCCNIDRCPKSNKLSALFEDEIADEVGPGRQTVTDKIKELPDLDRCPKPAKLYALS
jgi:hypothetical protein